METLTSVTPTTVTDNNSTPRPESTVTGKTAIVKSGSREAKSQMQVDLESGMSYAEVAAKHNTAEANVRQRAHRGKWLTPTRLKTITKAVTKQMTSAVAGAIAQDAIDKHVANTFKIASESVAKFKAKTPKSFKDLDIADKIARRSAQLENDDGGAQASILLLNESIERAGVAVEPIEARATLRPDNPALPNESTGLPPSQEAELLPDE